VRDGGRAAGGWKFSMRKVRKRYNLSYTKNGQKGVNRMTPRKSEIPIEMKEMDELEQMIEEKLEKVDLMQAVHRARLRSARLLNEQGISTLALIISKTLIDVIEHPEKMEMLA